VNIERYVGVAVLIAICVIPAIADDLEMREGEYYVSVQTIPANTGTFGSKAGYVNYKMFFGAESVEFVVLEGKNGRFTKQAQDVGAPLSFQIPYAELVNAVNIVYTDAIGQPTPWILLLGSDAKEKVNTEGLAVSRSETYLDGQAKPVGDDWLNVLFDDQSDDFFYLDPQQGYRIQGLPIGWFLRDCSVEEAMAIRLFYNRKASKGKFALGTVLLEDPLHKEFFSRLKYQIQEFGSTGVQKSPEEN